MLREIFIENYKSIQKLRLELGRVTVLIGENGSGKSNILEAIALASAAASDKLDNEFLASRGIRVTEPQFMRSAFEKENVTQPIFIQARDREENIFACLLQNDNAPYSKWLDKQFDENYQKLKFLENPLKEFMEEIYFHLDEPEKIAAISNITKEINQLKLKEYFKARKHLYKFLIYSPDNPSLRTFEKEGQIQPLGINGEGLFKLLKVLNRENEERFNELKKKIGLIDWFEDFEIDHNLSESEKKLNIRDRYLDADIAEFDQRSSNEGFLFLLFYFALFISDRTPNFFAIDNIDASLNPRLCRRLMEELIQLAVKYDKQVIFTTHNPAVLDGLNLEDDEQRLFVIYRNLSGHTKARRIFKPQPLEGQEPVKLSEAFLRGYIGGLPKNF